MAVSTCPKCSGRSWEIKLVEPTGAHAEQYFIQCSHCGTPAGLVGFQYAAALIREQAESIAELQKRLKAVEAFVRNIDHNVTKMARTPK
jgi:hypothetical protein